eukprot:TRINITY_DN14442_c1_g2_i2.p1 TRINITY_DN14442_c1_g2~~TRINITY_DN14442_c1_g2_i2.p1  ORF type:complete len:1012 (+),score=79.00 TRINITY_DN14442_c1_g2_i2:82-3117(+)
MRAHWRGFLLLVFAIRADGFFTIPPFSKPVLTVPPGIPVMSDYPSVPPVCPLLKLVDAELSTTDPCGFVNSVCNASLCIDGNTGGDPCMSLWRQPQPSAWLRVDLEQTASVCTVTIYNCQLCYADRLAFHEVWIGNNESSPAAIGNTKCAEKIHTTKEPLLHHTGGCVGQFVFVYLPPNNGSGSRTLNLLEVVVTGEEAVPTAHPSVDPTNDPIQSPASPPAPIPAVAPTYTPSVQPTVAPTRDPASGPSAYPAVVPSSAPAGVPSGSPIVQPPGRPTSSPTRRPTAPPVASTPTAGPTQSHPSGAPSASPTAIPTVRPTGAPTVAPIMPTVAPSTPPTLRPSAGPSAPSFLPTASPQSAFPTYPPSASPHSASPTLAPTRAPSKTPTTGQPSGGPTVVPTRGPSAAPPPDSNGGLRETLPDEESEAAAVALGFISGSGALMGNLALADTVCHSPGTMRNLSRALHPTGLEVGGNIYFGCLVGAACIVSGAALLSFTALGLLRLLDENGDGILGKDEIQHSFLRHIPVVKDSEAVDIAAIVRHPNTILLATLCIYQGMSFAALRLVITHLDTNGESVPVWERVVGGAVAAGLAALPIWFYRAVQHGLAAAQRNHLPGAGPQIWARVRDWDDPKPPRWLQWSLLGEQGDWVSCFRSKHWINSWEAAVRHFGPGYAAPGIAIEMWAMWALSFTNAFPTRSWRACGHVRMAGAVVHLFQLLFCVTLRPYRCVRDDVARILALGLLAAALIMIAAGFYKTADDQFAARHSGGVHHSGELEATAVILLQCATVVVLLQVLLRVLAEVVLLVKGWRANSQTLEWAEGEARLAELGGGGAPEEQPGGPQESFRSMPSEVALLSTSLAPLSPASYWAGSPRRTASAGRGRGVTAARRAGAPTSPGAETSPGASFSIIDLVSPGLAESSRSLWQMPPPRASRPLAAQGGRRAGRGAAPSPAPAAGAGPGTPARLRAATANWQGSPRVQRGRAATRTRRFRPLGDPTMATGITVSCDSVDL